MCISEYNEKVFVSGIREEGREEGLKEGIVKGKMTILIGLVKDGLITIADAAERANLTVTEFKKQMKVCVDEKNT